MTSFSTGNRKRKRQGGKEYITRFIRQVFTLNNILEQVIKVHFVKYHFCYKNMNVVQIHKTIFCSNAEPKFKSAPIMVAELKQTINLNDKAKDSSTTNRT